MHTIVKRIRRDLPVPGRFQGLKAGHKVIVAKLVPKNIWIKWQ